MTVTGLAPTVRQTAAAKERERQTHGRMVVDMFPETLPVELEEGDQRYTTRETFDWCLKRAGVDGIDLDVAACEEAHLAEAYFTKATDGVTRPWFGNVWCNPPFSDIEPWVKKAWLEMAEPSGPTVILMLLPACRTEQPWWINLIEPWRDSRKQRLEGVELSSHFLPGRTRFGHPGNRDAVGVGSPPFGCVLLVWKRLGHKDGC